MSWKQSKVHHYSHSPVGEEDRILTEKKPDIEELLLLGQQASVSHLQQAAVVSLQHPLALSPAPGTSVAPISLHKHQDVLPTEPHFHKLATAPSRLSSSQRSVASSQVGERSLLQSNQELLSRLAMPPPPPRPPAARAINTPTASTSDAASPPVSVSSTSLDKEGEEEEEDYPRVESTSAKASGQNRSDIEFDNNDQVLCRVCGDKASGFHYGVHSCEGCKGFFRRSIQQKIQYRPCTKNQQCNILRINRNRCQYCRLKKCIAAGMSRDAVRFGRVPKREKAKILAAMQTSRMKTQESKVLAEMQDDGKIIETIVRAHYDTCDYTRNKMEPFIQKAKRQSTFAICTGMTCPMKGRPEDSFLEQFSERFMDHVRQVCTFAKLIPGFKCLHHDDQVTLLKSCVFEVLLVRLAGLFENQGLVCLNGDIIRKETINRMPPGNAKFLMDSVFDLAQRLNQFRMSDAEIGLFCSVVIISADRPGLRNPDLVQKMQNKLKMVLNSILQPQHPEQASVFAELMAMIHDLRTLNTLHTEKFLQQCKVNGGQMPLAPAAPAEAAPNATAAATAAVAAAVIDRNGRWDQAQLDRESAGNASPQSSDTHSSTSTEDTSCRRSPIGSVSSSESSSCTNEISKLTAQDLRVNGSVLMNALTIPGAAAVVTTACSAAATITSASSAAPSSSSSNGLSSGSTSAATITVTRKRSHLPSESSVDYSALSASSASVATLSKYKVRKLDSPSDSGIDSPKCLGSKSSSAKASSKSTNTSVSSSPRSSEEDEVVSVRNDPEELGVADNARFDRIEEAAAAAVIISPAPISPPGREEMHPLLKRALQQPPQPYNNMPVATFQDEVYKPHKKFRRHPPASDDDPSSSTSEASSPPAIAQPLGHGHPSTSLLASKLSEPPQNLLASALRAAPKHSLLASSLSRATSMASDEHTKRNEILANLILNPSSVSPTSLGKGLLMCAAPSSSVAPLAAASQTPALNATSASASAAAASAAASAVASAAASAAGASSRPSNLELPSGRHIPVPVQPMKGSNPCMNATLGAPISQAKSEDGPQPLNLSKRSSGSNPQEKDGEITSEA